MGRMLPIGAHRISPGIYSHAGEMHIDAAELLKAHGIEPSAENQDQLEAIARDVAIEEGIAFEEWLR